MGMRVLGLLLFCMVGSILMLSVMLFSGVIVVLAAVDQIGCFVHWSLIPLRRHTSERKSSESHQVEA
jgi:hypothetical protein